MSWLVWVVLFSAAERIRCAMCPVCRYPRCLCPECRLLIRHGSGVMVPYPGPVTYECHKLGPDKLVAVSTLTHTASWAQPALRAAVHVKLKIMAKLPLKWIS